MKFLMPAFGAVESQRKCLHQWVKCVAQAAPCSQPSRVRRTVYPRMGSSTSSRWAMKAREMPSSVGSCSGECFRWRRSASRQRCHTSSVSSNQCSRFRGRSTTLLIRFRSARGTFPGSYLIARTSSGPLVLALASPLSSLSPSTPFMESFSFGALLSSPPSATIPRGKLPSSFPNTGIEVYKRISIPSVTHPACSTIFSSAQPPPNATTIFPSISDVRAGPMLSQRARRSSLAHLTLGCNSA